MITPVIQTFVKSVRKLLYSTIIEGCRLLSEPHFNFIFDLIIVVEGFSTKMMTKRTNCFLRSLKKGIRDHRWPTCSLFVINIGPTFREMMTPFRYILSIHNVPINRNNFFVNIRRSLTFSMKENV
ncbi:uncharacterized protein TNCV_718941 [Trichonephila clavipes]|nr:uncharacterized protein TNCV_718941 [Trichonephila clavipes]